MSRFVTLTAKVVPAQPARAEFYKATERYTLPYREAY
jgi:hypothetical protein